MQYRVTGWGSLTREANKGVGKGKKYLKFVAPAEEKSSADIGADIVATSDEQQKKDQEVIYPEKPSKMRYQPGKDRAQHRRKE